MHVGRAMAAAVLTTMTVVTSATALPIELRDENGTRYQVNTQVDPLIAQSTASGSLTDAFIKPITATGYWIGFTPWFGFTTVYTVQQGKSGNATNAS